MLPHPRSSQERLGNFIGTRFVFPKDSDQFGGYGGLARKKVPSQRVQGVGVVGAPESAMFAEILDHLESCPQLI
jgi:hypothetical protein